MQKNNQEVKKVPEEGMVLLVDKPYRWSSFKMVKRIRGISRVKKVGHGGTLDPLATGLLILGLGKKTKELMSIMGLKKEYSGCIRLGLSTPSFDAETNPISEENIRMPSVKELEQAVVKLTGEITQIPPVYSALKIDGERAYKLARKGKEVTMKARKTTVFEFEVTAVDFPNVFFRISCSKGTYIRSLANSLGEILGCGGYLASLRRTKIGDFDIKNATTWEQFQKDYAPLR